MEEGCVNHLTHIIVISVMIKGMDDPGCESPGAGSGARLGPTLRGLWRCPESALCGLSALSNLLWSRDNYSSWEGCINLHT